MREDRKEEILDKISQIATNDPTASEEIEFDIKVFKNEEDNVVIDLVAHQMMTSEDEADRMSVYLVAALSTISNASLEFIDK